MVGDDWTWRNEPMHFLRKPFLDSYVELMQGAIASIAQPELAAAQSPLLNSRARPMELDAAEAATEVVPMSDEVRKQLESGIGWPLPK